jgi:NADP-dependent 3-hydroxy acid dehydrogenase YdfG
MLFVTGGSSGFGALAAAAVARASYTAIASMCQTNGRNESKVKEVQEHAGAHDVDLRAIELNVLSRESADTAIKTIISKNGRLDVVIRNAGHMVFGPAEAFTTEQFAQPYDINPGCELR